MKISIQNPIEQKQLTLKSQTVVIDAYFNTIHIEATKDELHAISYADIRIEWQGGELEIPHYVNADNQFILTLELPHTMIRLLIKLNETQMISSETLADYANFLREYNTWSKSESQNVASIVEAIQKGDLSLLKMLDPLSGLDDETIIEEIEKTIPFLLEISAKPRMHLRAEEEVLDVSLVKRINASTLQHLSAHSEHWHSRTITGLRPARLKAEVYEDDFNIYENTFYRMTLQKVQQYLLSKGRQIAEAIVQKEDIADWSNYMDDMQDYRRMEILKQLLPTVDYDVNDKQLHQFERLLGKIQQLEKQLSVIMSSNFYQKLDRQRTIPLPVQPTNILTMDHRYNAVYKLWNILNKQREKTIQEGLDGKIKYNIELYYELYTVVTMIYAAHLLGYESVQSELMIQEDELSFSAIYDVGTSYLHVSTGTFEKRALQFELIEKLNEKFEVSQKVIPLLGEFSTNFDVTHLVFQKAIHSDVQRQLMNIVRTHMQQLPTNAQREWKAVDQQWRSDVTAFIQSFRTARSEKLIIVPLFQQMGVEEHDNAQLTSQLFASTNHSYQIQVCMPYELNQLQITDIATAKRLQTFGESFHKKDRQFANYKKGLFSVSQKDFHSVQRLMKSLFMFQHRLQMEWQLPYNCCPSCQSHNILKQDQLWQCREITCNFQWGYTKCTDQCHQLFAWMRPMISRKKQLSSNIFEAMKEKELIFGYNVLTDFSIRNQDRISYIPICPTCGSNE